MSIKIFGEIDWQRNASECVFSIKDNAHSLAFFFFYSFFFFGLRFPKSFRKSGAKNAGARHTIIFIAIYPFPTDFGSTIYALIFEKCVSLAKNLSLGLALLGLQ